MTKSKKIDYRKKTKKLIHEIFHPEEEKCKHTSFTREENSHYGYGETRYTSAVSVIEGYNICNNCKKKQFFREMYTKQLGLYNEHKSGFYSD